MHRCSSRQSLLSESLANHALLPVKPITVIASSSAANPMSTVCPGGLRCRLLLGFSDVSYLLQTVHLLLFTSLGVSLLHPNHNAR